MRGSAEESAKAFLGRDHSGRIGTKHHVLPRFYIQRFADAKGVVRLIDRETGVSRLSKPENALLQRNFYTMIEKGGDSSGSVEALIGVIEGLAAIAIKKLEVPPFREFSVPLELRETLSSFAALQAVRGHRHRRNVEIITDLAHRLEVGSITPENVTEFLNRRGVNPTDKAIAECLDVVSHLDDLEFVPHTNDSIHSMLKMWPKLHRYFEARPMTVINFGERCLATCDEPLLLVVAEENHLMGSGFATADEIWFPLSPSHLLVFGPLGGSLEEGFRSEKARNVADINRKIMSNSHLVVVACPDVAHLGLDPIPGPQPAMFIHTGTDNLLHSSVQRILNQRAPIARFYVPSADNVMHTEL